MKDEMIPNYNLIKAIWDSVGKTVGGKKKKKTVGESKVRNRWKP